ncbi:MAG: molybdopterin-guanine dinucleotide biosynthesis protein B [Endomicrobiia bacterium]
MRPIISIVGKTNSGKTTLIEKIIPELKKRGYKVGTIKHDVHGFEIDHEGKDTWRMTQAGADSVVIASDKKLALIKNIVRLSFDELVEWLFPDVDIVITEGYKKQNKPKIEVTNNEQLLCTQNDNLIAVVFNNKQSTINYQLSTNLNVPCFTIDDIENIVNLIEEKFLERR